MGILPVYFVLAKKRGLSPIIFGGERGIRTLGTTVSSTRDFQSRSFGQLGHLSLFYSQINNRSTMKTLAERVGFEYTPYALNLKEFQCLAGL